MSDTNTEAYLNDYKVDKHTKTYIIQSGDSEQKEYDFEKISKALDIALDVRKFEIELYWKRATYFWAFIAAVFIAYYKVDELNLKFLLASTGLLFSVGWFLVNKGSKYWQNNWERHVDALEDMVVGPLYKTILEDSGKGGLTNAAAYSVTKINQILSSAVIYFWMLLFFGTILDFPGLNTSISCFNEVSNLYRLYDPEFQVSIVLFGYALFGFMLIGSKSNHVKKNNKTIVNMKRRSVVIKSEGKCEGNDSIEIFDNMGFLFRICFYFASLLLIIPLNLGCGLFNVFLKPFIGETKVDDYAKQFSNHIDGELYFFTGLLGICTFILHLLGYDITSKLILRELGILLIFITVCFEVPFSEYTDQGAGLKGKFVARVKEAYRVWSVVVVLLLVVI